ncbi:hypothetical protein L218DRAFT_846008, partial [Marasmius fiardii PR-910]
MITVYDMGPHRFPDDFGGCPHFRKCILTLRYKSLPYKVEIVHYSNIEAKAQLLGAEPTTTNATTGKPVYTLPILHDSSSSKAISDSFRIAEYLDEAYPHTPRVFPEGTKTVQTSFIRGVEAIYLDLTMVMMDKYTEWMSTELAESRKKLYPKLFTLAYSTLSIPQQREEWEKLRGSYEFVFKQYYKEEGSEFILGGDEPVFADFALASPLAAVKFMFGEDSMEWKEVKEWNGG